MVCESPASCGQLGQLDRKIKVGQPFQPGLDLADLVRNLLLGGIGIKIRVVFGQRLHQIVQILLPRLHGIVRRARQRQSAQHHSRTQASRQPLLHAHVRSPLCIIINTQIYIRAGNLITPCFSLPRYEIKHTHRPVGMLLSSQEKRWLRSSRLYASSTRRRFFPRVRWRETADWLMPSL